MEERQIPSADNAENVAELIQQVGTSREQDWRVFRHGVPTDEAAEQVAKELLEVREDDGKSEDEVVAGSPESTPHPTSQE